MPRFEMTCTIRYTVSIVFSPANLTETCLLCERGNFVLLMFFVLFTCFFSAPSSHKELTKFITQSLSESVCKERGGYIGQGISSEGLRGHWQF